MSWRVAKSLTVLLGQVNKLAPNRNKSSDGTIGDAKHAASKSEHNPDSNGVVRAIDITHDPNHGINSQKLAEALVASRDPRIKYIISNRKICSGANESQPAWVWRSYGGSNPHNKHVHLSVVAGSSLYDNSTPWVLKGFTPTGEVPKEQTSGGQRFIGITATVFGGNLELEKSAYDGKPIGDTVLGVALPYRFKSARPQVRVFNGLRSVVCDIVDVGPWNINDPYWNTGARPQAESGTDKTGRPTNKAGIDLTPAAARTIGLQGKGLVDWEFVGAKTTEKPKVDPGVVIAVGAGGGAAGALVAAPNYWPWALAGLGVAAVIAWIAIRYRQYKEAKELSAAKVSSHVEEVKKDV